MSASKERLLTTSEAAVILGVVRQTVFRLIQSGELPAIPVGPKPTYVIRYDDVISYKASLL